MNSSDQWLWHVNVFLTQLARALSIGVADSIILKNTDLFAVLMNVTKA